ncbi:MAG: hypothetical protein SGJ01_11785 [Gemmatimonadota bacterium]|nr:hypothetical protein [Gemmatimonadota bacterium]
MDALIRIKLEVGDRVVGFCRTHPSDNPGLNTALEKLEGRLARATLLDEQHRNGEITVKASVLNKTDLRATIRDGLVLVAGLAEAAEGEQPDLAVRVRVPLLKVSQTSFVNAARVAVRQAMDVEPLLKSYGLPDTLLAELSAALDRIDTTEDAKEAGRNAQVGATADLDKVTGEIMRILRQLDRLNRHLFREDAELMAAWKRARNLPFPAREKAVPKEPLRAA